MKDKTRWLLESMKPRYWHPLPRFSAEWDQELNSLLDKGLSFESGYSTSKLGVQSIWIANHPYASFSPYNDPRFGTVRPRRRTIVRAWEKLEKDRKTWDSQDTRPAKATIGQYANFLCTSSNWKAANSFLTNSPVTASFLTATKSALTIPDDHIDDIKELSDKISSLRDAESVRISCPMPDHVATLTGWRGWRVDEKGLKALGLDTGWEPKKAIPALCKCGVLHQDRSPSLNCACGYWSFKSMGLLQEALSGYADSVVVVGSVEIWGKVIECENGYRSEFAYPKELWLLKPDLDYLSWTYGVPVKKLSE